MDRVTVVTVDILSLSALLSCKTGFENTFYTCFEIKNRNKSLLQTDSFDWLDGKLLAFVSYSKKKQTAWKEKHFNCLILMIYKYILNAIQHSGYWFGGDLYSIPNQFLTKVIGFFAKINVNHSLILFLQCFGLRFMVVCIIKVLYLIVLFIIFVSYIYQIKIDKIDLIRRIIIRNFIVFKLYCKHKDNVQTRNELSQCKKYLVITLFWVCQHRVRRFTSHYAIIEYL